MINKSHTSLDSMAQDIPTHKCLFAHCLSHPFQTTDLKWLYLSTCTAGVSGTRMCVFLLVLHVADRVRWGPAITVLQTSYHHQTYHHHQSYQTTHWHSWERERGVGKIWYLCIPQTTWGSPHVNYWNTRSRTYQSQLPVCVQWWVPHFRVLPLLLPHHHLECQCQWVEGQ